jgi:hydrogenase expression/formation protein HypC
MCLAIPGKIVDRYEENGLLMGRIDYAGTTNTACLAYIDQPMIGEFVLVHAGFAINRVNEEEARKTLEHWDEIVARAAADGEDIFGMPLDVASTDSTPSEDGP